MAPRWNSLAEPAATDGERVTEFIGSYCRLVKGPQAGQGLSLRPWQRDIVDGLYATSGGLRLHRTALIGLPRKSGKSLLGSGLALYGLLADAEPGAEVYSVAGSREQARIIFDVARRQVQLDPVLSRYLKVYRTEIAGPDGIYKVLAADAGLAQGLNPSLVLFDELAHCPAAADLWVTMTQGSATRTRPLVIGITTAGPVFTRLGFHSQAYRMYQYGKQVCTGELQDDAFYFHWWEPADPTADHRLPATWAQANPGLGDFQSEDDFEASVRQTSESAFRTYRCNQWTSSAETWLPHGSWGVCAEPDVVVEPGARVVLGFDGSFSGDSTALVLATVEPRPFVKLLGLWEKPPTEAQWRVDHADVERHVLDACATYKVVEVVCDPHLWRRDIEAWLLLKVPVVEYPQTASRMVPATQRFYEAVTTGRMRHDGNASVARHIDGCAVQPTPTGPRLTKAGGRNSQARIDAAVAAVMAYTRASILGTTPVRQFKAW